MNDITPSGDFLQVTNLRTVSAPDVSRPDSTITDRPVESDAGSAGTQSNASQSGNAFSGGRNEREAEDPLERAAQRLQEIIGSSDLANRNTRLRISLDEENDRFIYQSIDEETGEIVRQFPPEEIVDLLRSFRSPEGVTVDDSV